MFSPETRAIFALLAAWPGEATPASIAFSAEQG